MTTGDNRHFILSNTGDVIPADSVLEWDKWLETAGDTRVVKKTLISESPHIWVSTVFLGLNHNFDDEGPPLLFETMIFRNDDDGDDCWRYATRDEALVGHDNAVKIARSGAASTPRTTTNEPEKL